MKKFKAILLAFTLAVMCIFSLGGCVPMDEYLYIEGITVVFYSASEARIEFVSEANPDDREAVKACLESALDKHFDYELVQESYINSGSELYLNSYDVTFKNGWTLSGDSSVNEGFFFADVEITYSNPFVDRMFVEGEINTLSPFSGLISDLKNDTYFNSMVFGDITSSLIVLIPSGKNQIEGAESVYRDFTRYAQWTLVGDNKTLPNITYSYTALFPVGWYTLILIVALATIGAIILLAKKKDGEMVENKPLYTYNYNNNYNNYNGYNNYNNPNNYPNNNGNNNPINNGNSFSQNGQNTQNNANTYQNIDPFEIPNEDSDQSTPKN